WPLIAHHSYKIPGELARLKSALQFRLIMEDFCRCFNNMAVRFDGRNFYDGVANIPGEEFKPACRLKSFVEFGDDFFISALRRYGFAYNFTIRPQFGLCCIRF